MTPRRDASSGDFPVARVRFARPTDRLEECVAFYRDGVGLELLGSFEDHAGYDGVFLGLPGERNLELTRHASGSPGDAPSRDNLLVLYVTDDTIERRLRAAGHGPVEPENPYWGSHGALTFEDPDGWRVVLRSESG